MSESFRDIRLFVAAYEERSFTAAATRENATQSGVSQHIRKLEERFGARLFMRAGGSVAPTAAGDVYYRHCVDLLRAYHETNEALRPFAKGLEGEVMIGLMPTMTRRVLAPALQEFLDRYPNISVHVIEAYSGVLIEQVRAGALAFAIVPAFAGGAGLRQRLFARTREVLVAQASAAQPNLAPVRLAGREPLKLILPRPQNSRRDTIEAYVASNGVRIDRVIELDSMMGTLDLVATSEWVAILPGLMMAGEAEPQRYTVNPLDQPPLWLDLVQIESAQRVLPAAAQAFSEALAAATHRLNRPWSDPAMGEPRAIPAAAQT